MGTIVTRERQKKDVTLTSCSKLWYEQVANNRCARSFRQYHGQRISHAIVMTDALNIHDGILKLKKMVLQRRAAWTRGTGW